jgi:hypothetical protein
MSSQARLTVSAAAETFLEALQTQEITDKQMDAMLAECSTRQTDNSKKIKMVVNGVPGMSTATDNCTYLDLYYPDTTDTTKVYADFTTVIGDQTENVRVILVVEDPNTNNTGRFKNQIDIAGNVNKEQLRFTEGVGMTSPAKRAQGVTDNTILLRGKAFEESSDSIVYSDVVYAPGSTATWGGGNTLYGNQIFLDGDSKYSYAVALIYPELKECIKFLKENKKLGDIDYDKISYDDLCGNKDIENEIVKDCDIVGRKSGLKGFELPKKIRIINEPFSLENGLMTNTLKLKPKNIRIKYNGELKKMYEEKL